jgi:hypothetical protein
VLLRCGLSTVRQNAYAADVHMRSLGYKLLIRASINVKYT